MKSVLYRVGATLFTAAAIVGMLTITGFPATVGKQVLMGVLTASAVQLFIVVWNRRIAERK